MARLAPVTALFALRGATALSVQTTPGRNCSCLNWKEVYSKFGITCGQGLERYADTMELDEMRVTAVAQDVTVQEWKEKDVCRHLFKRMNHNYAMNTRIAPLEMPNVWPKPQATLEELSNPKVWCYIRNTKECNQPKGHQIPNSLVSIRVMDPGEETAMRDLSFEQIAEIAKKNVIDLGRLLPNAGNVMMPDRKFDMDNATSEVLDPIRKTGKPTMLMGKDLSRPRMFVQGDKTLFFRPGWPQGSVALADTGKATALAQTQ